MSPLSYVLIRNSKNFGDTISCFRFHMPPTFVECPPPNGGSILLAGNIVVGSGGFGEYFWDSVHNRREKYTRQK